MYTKCEPCLSTFEFHAKKTTSWMKILFFSSSGASSRTSRWILLNIFKVTSGNYFRWDWILKTFSFRTSSLEFLSQKNCHVFLYIVNFPLANDNHWRRSSKKLGRNILVFVLQMDKQNSKSAVYYRHSSSTCKIRRKGKGKI